MHILVIHQHYWPETAATAQLLTDLCEDLVDRGHEVTVIAGQPSYHRDRTADRLPSSEQRRGVTIVRVPSFTPKSRGIPARLLHYGSFGATSWLRSVSTKQVDVCLVMSTPPILLGASAMLLSALRGIPFVYSVQDLYPDVAIHLGVLKADSLVTRLSEAMARATYQSAASVVTLSPGMARSLAEKGVPHERLHVVANWADTASVKPEPRDNAFARAHDLVERFVVQYAGNLGLSQGLEHVIEAASILRDRPIVFALVGEGSVRAQLEQQARRHDLRNVRFLPAQPRERLSELLASSDVGFVSQKNEVSSDLVPSKLYGIMAAARPVLAAVPDDSEVARVLRAANCGWVIAPESPAALVEGIQAAFSCAQAAREAMGARGRTMCIREYSREASTARYEHVLEAARLRHSRMVVAGSAK